MGATLTRKPRECERKKRLGRRGQFYSLPALEATGFGKVSRLPVSIRIVLELVLRNVDGQKVTERRISWQHTLTSCGAVRC